MTPSIEERIQGLETTSRTHDAMLDLLISICERQQTLLEEIQVEVRAIQVEVKAIQVEVKEIHRDTQQTQRLWVRLAQRYGWLEDDDWPTG